MWFWKKITFESFYAQNYSQKVCSRSILNRPICFWGLFYMKKPPSYTFHIFLWVHRLWVYLYFTHTQKQKQKYFRSPTLIFWWYVLEWYFCQFLQKTKEHSLWPEFCFFFCSHKISFADLWSLFIERITYYKQIAWILNNTDPSQYLIGLDTIFSIYNNLY